MGMKILMGCVCIVPMMLIFYGIMYFEGKPKGNILFGVTLWPEAFENEKIKQMQRLYKKRLLLINIITIALFAAGCIPERESISMSIFMMLILGIIIAYFIPFAMANRQLASYKLSVNKTNGAPVSGEKIAVDIKAVANREPVMFKKTGLAGMIAGLVPFVLEIFMGTSSDMKGYNLLIVGVLSAVGVIMFCMLFVYSRMKTDIVSTDSAVNIQVTRVRNYQLSRMSVIFIWANTAFVFYVWIRMWADYIEVTEIVIVSFIYVLIVAVAAIVAQIKIRKAENKYKGEYISEADDDRYWLWGMVYYNKNDKSFMVNKRTGIGNTINMAKPAGKIMMAVVGIIVALSIIGSSVWMILLDFTPVSLNIEQGKLISSQMGDEYTISLNTITKAELIDELPDMSKRVGTGMDTLYKGSWREKDGTDCQVCVRINGGCYIKIETVSGRYYLNDEDESDTKSLYYQLTDYIENK